MSSKFIALSNVSHSQRYLVPFICNGRIVQSIKRLTMDWIVRVSNPGRGGGGGDEISYLQLQTGTGYHPTSCTILTGPVTLL
jgi:hypothetical protein